MGTCVDFLDSLEPDMSRKILTSLDNISDIVRASAVSRTWRNLVITYGICKQLCVRLFPQLSNAIGVLETSNCEAKESKESEEVAFSGTAELEQLGKEHRNYAYLARACESFSVRNCISEAIVASSTDNHPQESIENTLQRRDIIAQRASYWSSKGQKEVAVPETLTYKLASDICVINEIIIRPFQAFFQPGLPIYSARAVRFRLGHSKNLKIDLGESNNDSASDEYVWTYTSQEFPMAQEYLLQKFELPKPVLCIGGILQIELLGRVQRQEMDGLYYICVAYVQAMGKQLSPAFDIDFVEPSGKFILKRNLDAESSNQTGSPENEHRVIPPTYLQRRVGELQQIVNMLRGNVVNIERFGWDDEEDDSDEEFVA